MSGKHRSVKVYGHDQGWSCCFRQWRATHSHCSLLHGYALAVKIEFEADNLDDKNWVMDFGGLGYIKHYLKSLLDHTLLVAEDDPQLDQISALAGLGLADIRVLPAVGCEAVAQHIFNEISDWLLKQANTRVRVHRVDVYEHNANGASYVRT